MFEYGINDRGCGGHSIDHYIARRVGEFLPFCISPSFYFDTQFIYAFCSFLANTSIDNSTDMRSFTTVLALASVVPAVMSLTINTPYVLSSSLNVEIVADFCI
jgi:hypothetical protein